MADVSSPPSPFPPLPLLATQFAPKIAKSFANCDSVCKLLLPQRRMSTASAFECITEGGAGKGGGVVGVAIAGSY